MESEDYALIKKTVKSLLDISLDDYKEEQMKRRLDSWLVRVGAAAWPDYFRRLRAEPPELSRFRNYLTINVSSFFRDPERWQGLRQKVIPALLQTSNANARVKTNTLTTPHAHLPGGLRLWSAGCSIGLEAYSLAMLMDELTPGRRHYLLATDLDRGALEKARARGPYTAEDIQYVTPQQRAQYFEPQGPPHFVTPALAARVLFREHNLMTGLFESDFDLIICRNVVIYFTEEAKQRLYRKFYAALRPGGILFMGGTEVIATAHDIGFHNFGISFYQKAETP